MSKAKKRVALLIVIALLVTLAMPMTALAADDVITSISPQEGTSYISGSNPGGSILTAVFEGDSIDAGTSTTQEAVWRYVSVDGGAPETINLGKIGTDTGTKFIQTLMSDKVENLKVGTYKFWAEILDEKGALVAKTQETTLTVLPAMTPQITSCEWNAPSYMVGNMASAAVGVDSAAIVNNGGKVSFQWQVKKDNADWTNVTSENGKYSGFLTSGLNINKVSYTENGDLYRCVVTATDKDGEEVGSATSKELELVVVEPDKTPVVTITSEPEADEDGNVTIKVGRSIVMTAEAETKFPQNSFTYQWTKDGKPIPGETGQTLTINATEAAEAAAYNCKVTNTVDSIEYTAVAAQGINLTINNTTGNVEITAQPKSKTVNAKANVEFAVAAQTDDGAALSYQWERSLGGNGVFSEIKGATSDTLRVENVTYSMSGYKYRCIVSNAEDEKAAPATSDAATLTVKPLGHVVEWIGAEDAAWAKNTNAIFTAKSGNALELKVEVATEAGDALAYQWQVMDGTWRNIAGAASSSYRIANVGLDANGAQYKCIVTNPYDNKETEYIAELKVLDSSKIPVITSQPQALTEVKVGAQDVVLTVEAEALKADQKLTYKWEYRGKTPGVDWTLWTEHLGVTGNTMPVNTGTMSIYEYRCIVTADGYTDGAVTSEVARVNVYEENVPYIITDLEENATGYVGETYTFNVDAKVDPNAELLYIWTKDGVVVKEATGAAGASYTTPMLSLDDKGDVYKCEIRNAAMYDELYGKQYKVDSITCALDVKASTLAPVLPGDLNGNGRVDIEDITTAVDAMTGVITLDAEQLAIADLNGNGRVDIEDITEMVDLMNTKG